MSSEKRSIVEQWREGHENPSIPDLGHASLFWRSILSLFKNLLRLAKTSEHFLPRSELFPRFVSELQRFYLWGDGVSASQGHLDKVLDRSDELRHHTLFIMDQLSRALSNDLYPLVHTKSRVDGVLAAAMKEIDQMQKATESLLGTDEADVDSEPDCPLQEDLEMVSLGADEVLEDVITYIDCLMDLCDALENPVSNLLDEEDVAALTTGAFSVRSEVQIYCRRIRDQYPLLPTFLVERLGNLNWKRYQQLAAWERMPHAPTDHLDLEDCKPSVTGGETTATVSSSLFDSAGSGLDAMSISTFGTTESTISKGKPRVPALPEAASGGAPFSCPVCHMLISGITSRVEWKKHVYSDLRSYCCIFQDCRHIQADMNFAMSTYSSSSTWMQHLIFHLGSATVSWRCPVCGPDSPLLVWQKLFKHIGRHLQEISLSVLPRSLVDDQITDDDDDIGDDGSIGPDSVDIFHLQPQHINPSEVDSGKQEKANDYDRIESTEASSSQWPHDDYGVVETEEDDLPGPHTNPDEFGISSIKNVRTDDPTWSNLQAVLSNEGAKLAVRRNQVPDAEALTLNAALTRQHLWCEFVDLIGCKVTFEVSEERAWVEHHMDHLRYNLPQSSHCWFCDDFCFNAESAGDEFATFFERMEHIRRDIIQNPRLTINDMRADFYMIPHVRRSGLLFESMYQHAIEYDELPLNYRLPVPSSSTRTPRQPSTSREHEMEYYVVPPTAAERRKARTSGRNKGVKDDNDF